jgi:hypothetical protein
VPGVVWSVPSVQIRDVPRFGWRGLLIDTSRTFFPKEFLLRQLELMALYKLSVLHLHLTDDQGWRLEIESHPKLHELGSQWDAQRAPNERSGYYTKADIREIVDRATALGIEVLPEIDMPGHIVAALHALPELACRTAPDQPRSADEFPIVPATERPFPKNILCVCDERVYEVIQAVLDEVIALFPNAFVHVGGDEVVRRDEWEQGYLCRDLIERGVVESTDHLQGYFQKRIEDFLRSRGRRMIAWDEALVHEQPDTPSERLSQPGVVHVLARLSCGRPPVCTSATWSPPRLRVSTSTTRRQSIASTSSKTVPRGSRASRPRMSWGRGCDVDRARRTRVQSKARSGICFRACWRSRADLDIQRAARRRRFRAAARTGNASARDARDTAGAVNRCCG